MIARDSSNNNVVFQANEVSTRPDGTARFAVISAQIPKLMPGENRVVNLFKGAAAPSSGSFQVPSFYDFKIQATVYGAQLTEVRFGNRNGQTAGTPFLVGQVITLTLNGPATESHSVTVDSTMAGGGWETLSKIAAAFMSRVNSNSAVYKVNRMGDAYEKMWLSTVSPKAGAFTVSFSYGGAAPISQNTLRSYTTPMSLVSDSAQLLKSAVSSGAARRLDGPAVQEYTTVARLKDPVTNVVHPQLTARLHTRLFADGKKVRTDMVIENAWAYEAAPGNLTYDVKVTHGGNTFVQEPFTHNHHSRWHKVFWTGPQVSAKVRHHMPYFMASGAIWNYNQKLYEGAATVKESVLSAEASALAAADTKPMGKAFITPYFPMTGGRSDIGPVPRWTALYLTTQDQRALDSMLANADAAAGIPVHFRDLASDQPLDLDRHPCVALVFGTSCPQDALPAMADQQTMWTVDSAHQPSFSYVPYLVTGDAFYLDEVMFWASWNMAAVNPGLRGQTAGLIKENQLRGQAWSLRSIGEAARALPDAHPMKPYFEKRLQNNLTWYVTNYARNSDTTKVSPMNVLTAVPGSKIASIWQGDFFTLVIGLLAKDGDPLAKEMHDWMSKFQVQRFLKQSEGYCLTHAPANYINVRYDDSAPATTWTELFQLNWPGVACGSTGILADAYPSSALGYAANGAAMLSNAADIGTTGATQAYKSWATMTPSLPAAMQKDPTWALAPAN
ncbi:hypothetical protein [Hydrogenophaga sp. RAC07]|uniref:hypothetical protein n=1 Tax=Hydrogenophaga sp. RAC07 TaxID=1842537 RepID=UPI00083D5964|nr:hypothetical protein [Hydrogenophaga sp. RAC07]